MVSFVRFLASSGSPESLAGFKGSCSSDKLGTSLDGVRPLFRQAHFTGCQAFVRVFPARAMGLPQAKSSLAGRGNTQFACPSEERNDEESLFLLAFFEERFLASLE